MSEEKKPAAEAAKPAAKKSRPSESEIRKALGKAPELVSVDGARVSVIYPDLVAYNAQVSRDVEALRALCEIASSEVDAFDPKLSALLTPNTPVSPAHMPKPDGAQRLVVAFV